MVGVSELERGNRSNWSANVRAAFNTAKLGIPALCMLAVGSVVEFFQESRPNQDCHHLITDWFWLAGSVGFFAMLLSLVVALIGVFADKKRLFSTIALVSFLPCFLLILGASGCG